MQTQRAAVCYILVDMDNTISGPYIFQSIVKVWSFGLVSYICTQP